MEYHTIRCPSDEINRRLYTVLKKRHVPIYAYQDGMLVGFADDERGYVGKLATDFGFSEQLLAEKPDLTLLQPFIPKKTKADKNIPVTLDTVIADLEVLELEAMESSENISNTVKILKSVRDLKDRQSKLKEEIDYAVLSAKDVIGRL